MSTITRSSLAKIRKCTTLILSASLIACVFGAVSAPASMAADGSEAAVAHGWGNQIAGDEFNYTGAPDKLKWGVYNSVGHAGNGLRSPSAITVADGAVTIKGDAQGTTGGMSAKFARQTYGRWETRMRVDQNDPQYHPVLILWPDTKEDAYGGKCWEIDYAEGNKGDGIMSFFNHIACTGTVHTWGRKALDTRQWHNYAVEWSPEAVTGYIDGVKWFEDRNPANISNVSMHQTIQLDWFPNGGPTQPSQLQVDWVRVYDINGKTPAPAPEPTPEPASTPTFSSTSEIAAVDSSGILWNYHDMKTPRTRVISGFGTMDSIHVTDWNGDGTADLLAKDKSGILYLYRGLTTGGFMRSAIGSSGWQDYEIDVAKWKTADTKPSIIAKNKVTAEVFVYSNPTGVRPGTRVKMGSGWGNFSLNALDWDKDGNMDLLANSTATGKMYLYRTNGNGTFISETRTVIGTGWNSFNSLTTARNFQGSGADGLLARDTNGVLQYHGTGTGTWLSGVSVGTGWSGFKISAN